MKAVTGGVCWSRIVSGSLPLLPFNMLLALQSATPPHHDGLKPWKPLARYWATGLLGSKEQSLEANREVTQENLPSFTQETDKDSDMQW